MMTERCTWKEEVRVDLLSDSDDLPLLLDVLELGGDLGELFVLTSSNLEKRKYKKCNTASHIVPCRYSACLLLFIA